MTTYDEAILVVDDSADERFLLERAFGSAGVTVPIHEVASALEAIAYLRGDGAFSDRSRFRYPTFILTDLEMPGGDGFALLKYMQSCAPELRPPVVVYSSSADPLDMRRARELGACAYHVKPHTYERVRFQIAVLHAYWKTCEFAELPSTAMFLASGADPRNAAEPPQDGHRA